MHINVRLGLREGHGWDIDMLVAVGYQASTIPLNKVVSFHHSSSFLAASVNTVVEK